MRVTLAAVCFAFVASMPAQAAPPSPPPVACITCDGDSTTVVTAIDDHFGVREQRKPSDHVPGRGTLADGERPEKTTWTTVDEYAAPMCSSNGLNGIGEMCMQAATYCLDGRVGFWVWHQVTTYTRGPEPNSTITKDVGTWRQEDGSYCLGADDPQVPTIGKVVSWVQDHFDNLAIAPAGITVAPEPRTLVNIETRLHAGASDPTDIPTTTPWSAVVVHAKPLRWRWFFGDGTQSPAMTTPDVTHVYRQARLHEGVRVEVEWGGTFSVAGDPTAYPIVGTALVTSAAITLDVREARAQLVSR